MTEEALKRISEEKKEKTGVLNLGNCNLIEIPEEIEDMLYLKMFILSNRVHENDFLTGLETKFNFKGRISYVPKFNDKHVLRPKRTNVIGELPPFLNRLTNLLVLICGGESMGDNYQIKEVRNLTNLKELRYLDLSYCFIENIDQLTHNDSLEFLNLSNNLITDFSKLAEIVSISELILNQNIIANIPCLKNLKNLSLLDLKGNKISIIENINGLTKLEKLDLSNNGINKIENISELSSLNLLYLNSNKIQKIENLQNLLSLECLNLHSNRISKIENLEGLANLKELDLYSNKIEKYENLESIQDELISLVLRDNPIRNLDPAITAEYNCLSNLKTWKQELTICVTNNYYKTCLLGDTRVGKSSLLDRLKYNRFDPHKLSSHAIILETYENRYHDLKIEGNGILNLQFFDFGGQDIYHGTHRWFLKGRHLNIILYNADHKDTQEIERKNLEYWIKICIQNNPYNPILLVQSKCKRDGIQIPRDFDDLRNKFRQVLPNVVHLDSEFDDIEINGFDKLKESIGLGIQQVLGFEMEIPQSFDDSRNYLINHAESNKEIDHEELKVLAKDTWKIGKHYDFEVCYNLLLKWLQGVGVIFYNENILCGRIILDQKWAIEAIYKLFEPGGKLEKLLKQDGGRIHLSNIYDYLANYNEYEKELLINYLKSSYTVFEIGYSFYKVSDERIFVCPRYLPYTNNLKLSPEAKCNFTLKIEQFSILDYQDLISILNGRLTIYTDTLCKSKFEFDYLGYNCNGQIHFKEKEGVFISLFENESNSLEPVIRDALESLGFRVKDGFTGDDKPTVNYKPTARIFISYAHKYSQSSRIFIEKFESFSKNHSNIKIESWYDDQIFIGEDWHKRIQTEINKSNLCILLLCQDFFNSAYIKNHELKNFLEQNEINEYPILPVLLSDYMFQDHEAILERKIFMPEASLFDDIPGDKISFNKLIYHRAQIIPEAINSPNVDTYFKHFRTRLDGVLEGIKSKLK